MFKKRPKQEAIWQTRTHTMMYNHLNNALEYSEASRTFRPKKAKSVLQDASELWRWSQEFG